MGVESTARPSRVGRRDGPRAQAMHETPSYADGDVEGDVLPIPVLVVEAVPSHNLSRGTRQRVNRRRKEATRINDCVSAVNWLAGTADGPPARVEDVHTKLYDDARAGARRMEAEQFRCIDGEALRALLRSGSCFEPGLDYLTVEPFKDSLVSLPKNVRDAPSFLGLLSPAAKGGLEEDRGVFVRGSLFAEDGSIADSGIKAYTDPLLGNNKAKYAAFLRRLYF